jgi:hypothetical protein
LGLPDADDADAVIALLDRERTTWEEENGR